MSEETLKLVLTEDLEELLTVIGLLDRIQNGDVLCSACGRTLSVSDISSIRALASGYELRCSSASCSTAIGFPSGTTDAEH